MKYQKGHDYRQAGFTLIELLVVIAIIGILSSVVLASLNSARQKGQIASIKSTLKNIIPQAELAYDGPGDYRNVCADPKIVSMKTAITNAGGTANCYSRNDAGNSDVYLRWGVGVIIGTSNPLQAFSVSSTGVVIWDTADKPDSNWDTANTACVTAGGRLPTLEELITIPEIHPSFANTGYWTNTTVPSIPANAYLIQMNNGGAYNLPKTSSGKVRCVR